MTEKYYRVRKDTFLWVAGAVLKLAPNLGKAGGYCPVEDIWNKIPLNTEYISSWIIEHPDNADYFERIYPDTLGGKIFKTKDQLVAHYNETFKA